MKHNPLDTSFLTPFLLWNNLAMQTAETMLASAQVIGHRAGRMAAAGATPSARDQREFTLMGQEKIEAGTESALAMATHMMSLSQPFGAQAFVDMMRGATAFMSLASSQTPQEMATRQAVLAREIERSAVSMADASRTATRLAHHGLKPIHARAIANAKRLGKR